MVSLRSSAPSPSERRTTPSPKTLTTPSPQKPCRQVFRCHHQGLEHLLHAACHVLGKEPPPYIYRAATHTPILCPGGCGPLRKVFADADEGPNDPMRRAAWEAADFDGDGSVRLSTLAGLAVEHALAEVDAEMAHRHAAEAEKAW